MERLAEDHRRARQFREALSDVPNIRFPMPSPTNIVFMDVPDALAFTGHVASKGVRVLPVSPTRVRAVFHLDVDDAGLERAISAMRSAAEAGNTRGENLRPARTK